MNKKATATCIQHLRTFIAGTLVVLLACGLLVGCAGKQQDDGTNAQDTPDIVLEDLPIEGEAGSDGIYLLMTIDEFNKQGFAFGDSLDVTFSNGYEMLDIPYYNGYYVDFGEPLAVGYPGATNVKLTFNYGDSLWDDAGLSEGDTVTVKLHERGAYLETQEALDISYTNDRDDYESDEVFANFRSLAGGDMAEGVVYRSASPIDNRFNRAGYVSALAEQAGINYILNLSDDESEADEDVARATEQGVDVSLFTHLRNDGKVSLLNLGSNYPSDAFAKTLVDGLVAMSKHDGPYLVHCVEGKDRTGFVCAVLEALCGATYEEILADYMITYDNYYGITRESDPSKYEAISQLNLDNMLSFLAGTDDETELESLDYQEFARDYLLAGGMTDEQIDALVARLTNKQ